MLHLAMSAKCGLDLPKAVWDKPAATPLILATFFFIDSKIKQTIMRFF